jgi:hypothetical protein
MHNHPRHCFHLINYKAMHSGYNQSVFLAQKFIICLLSNIFDRRFLYANKFY